uniref:Uncharacterized protein n=1 Tax=Neovison vison TaxID=452646 RepID=A0A8C6ZYG0_NEOVI
LDHCRYTLKLKQNSSGGGLDVRRQMSLKLIFKHASKANSVSQIATTMKGMPVAVPMRDSISGP